MENKSTWRLIATDPAGAAPRVLFEAPGQVAQAFTQSQLGATIRILRMQGQDTAEYEQGLKALMAVEPSNAR